MFIDVDAVTAILAAMMALSTAIGVVLRRRETRANTWAATFSDMANTVGELSQALDEERARRRIIENKFEKLRKGVRVLIGQLSNAGIVPKWEPGD